MINLSVGKFIMRSFRDQRYKEITGPIFGNVKTACELVQAEAKHNVSQSGSRHPQIMTGMLKENIKINIWRKGQTVKGYVGLTKDLFYGRMLEFGTIHIPPYPWLFPALKAKENEIWRLLRGR